jgi:hypothetical protein
VFLFIFAFSFCLVYPHSDNYSLSLPLPFNRTKKVVSCPKDLEPLIDKLLVDLPGYANRVSARFAKRSLRESRPLSNPTKSNDSVNIIVAGNPEFEPLPLSALSESVTIPENSRQVFITTLARVYQNNQALDYQEYHWLFFRQNSQNWQLIKMYSFRKNTSENKPTYPIESSEGFIAEAIRLWLRDCQTKSNR